MLLFLILQRKNSFHFLVSRLFETFMLERSVSLLNVLSSTDGLLLPEFESRRLNALVSQYSVKGDPRKSPEGIPGYKESREKLGELEAVRRSMLNSYDIHAVCEGVGRLALVRKMIPHGMNEMTVLAQEGYDGVAVDNIFGFSSDIRNSFYRVGISFCEYSEERGLYPVMSFTYDPHTYDRKSPQSVKIFHLQLTGREKCEMEEIKSGIVTLSSKESNYQRRQLIDESSIVTSLVAYDYFGAYPLATMLPVAPFTQDNCSNIRFVIGKDWSDMLSDGFDKDLGKIHNFITNFYGKFSSEVLDGKSGSWLRQSVLKPKAKDFVESIPWMQNSTRDSLKYYLNGLNSRHLTRVDWLSKHKLLSHVYPTADLCFGATFTRSNQGDIMLSIRPQIFAEAGATGLQYLDPIGAQVKFMRGEGYYNDDDLKRKVTFEKECAKFIVRNSNICGSGF